MENFTDEHLVPQLGYVATSHEKVVERVISRQTADSEDPLARHSVLNDAIRQIQEQVWRCRVVVPKLSISTNREQETYRIVKGEEEITLHNPKKQRIAQSTFMDDSDDEAQQRKRHRSLDFLIESSCEEEEDTASSESPKPRPSLNREVSNEFRPSSWITDVIPRKSPFVPQMGDEVIYFRQGHEAYVDAVCRNNLYPINLDKQPWKKMDLRDQEFVKITGIKYEVCPPTLCCLKLTQIDPGTGKITNKSFSVKYHDMPYVIDFLVLRQNYDEARSRIWKPNDHFRSVIDDAWWFGTIVCQEPYQSEYPHSHFQCIKVKWDNGEIEKLSPWHIEAIPENAQRPEAVGESVPVTDEERADILYKPQEDEWGGRSREDECARIIAAIDQLITVDIAAPFSGPVDLIQYPTYCTVIAYPTDLNSIRTRLKHNFYRRLSALIWETRYIYYNARTFNEPRSKIVQCAKLITDVLLKFISKLHCTDIMEIYNAVENMEYTEDEDMEDDDAPGTSTGRRAHQMELVQDRDAWKDACKQLLDYMFECENCEPFRQPVDQNDYQDYSEIIDSPMDLETVQRNLEEDRYENPTELFNDTRLIFANVKAYTPNKRSKIYSMTLLLSAFFEERIRKIIFDYKTAVKTSSKLRHSQRFKKRTQQQEPIRPPSPRGESTSQKRTAVKTQEQVEPPTTKSTSAKASPADRHRNKKRRRLSSTYSSMEDSNKSASSLSESENDSEISLSESKEEEFPSSSQPYRRETRATRRAMQNRMEGRKNVTGNGSEIDNSTGNDDDDDNNDDFSGKSSSLKRMQSSRAKSRNTRVTRSAEKRKPDDSPHVSGHRNHSHEESEDNSNEGETENESCNEEEESISRRKLIRKTARAAVCKMKQINDGRDKEEENNCRSRQRRNYLSNTNTSKMSDEETKAENPHQNGRNVDTQDFNNCEKINHMMSKSQKLESVSKARIAPKSQDEEDGKNEENESSSGEEKISNKKSLPARKNKPRRPAKSQSLDSASNASDESETALNQRRREKEDDSSEDWRQSDESEKDKKTFSRRPSLRALPTKKYIIDSEEDLDSEGEKQSWNIKRCSVSLQDCTKRRPQPSGESKRKHISTSGSEDGKPNDENGHGKPSGRKGKLFKSQEESSNESSSGSQSSPKGHAKRRLRARKQGAGRHKPSTSESENDNSCGKPWRAMRIRTCNLGKLTMNYRDKSENDSEVSLSELEEEESPSSSQPYRYGTRVTWRAMQNRKERIKNDDSPHVSGHRKHGHEESEDKSNEGESENESCNQEEESNSRRKLIKKTARVVVCEMKQINDVSEEEEENNYGSRRCRNHPGNANTSKMSDEETETPKAEIHPHQNGRKVDTQDLNNSENMMSKSQELESASKAPIAPRAIALKSGVKESSASRRKIKYDDNRSYPSDRKNEENESSSEEETISNKKSSPARKNKPRRPAKSQSLDSASNASHSSDKSETALNQRRKKKEDDSSEEWRQSDELEKDKKTFSRRPSLRALPKKKYIIDLDSEGEKQSWNVKRCFVLVRDCTKEDRKENCKPSDESGRGKHSGRKEKLFKSQQESSNESSSGSQRSPKECTKRRMWARKQGAVHHKPSTAEPEIDNSYGKLSRAARIRTRNRGKQTVNYRDITESGSEVDHLTENDDDDDYDDGKSSSLKRMQSRAKSRNTRVTRSTEKRKPDDSPHVSGHRKHSHEENEDNSNDGESEKESCNEEEESNTKRKLIRKTTRAVVCKMKQINNMSDEEEENNCTSRRRRNQPSNANTSKMSDEETETPKAEKHPHQNGGKVDTQDLNTSEKINHMMSKSQELESASKARIVSRAIALKSDVDPSSASRRKIKPEDEEDGKNEENESSSDMNKPRRLAKSQCLDSASNAFESSDESETALNQRHNKKEDDSSEEWRQSDESEKDKKTFSRRPSLRALPTKKYITDSDEDFDSEGEKQSWNGKRCSVSVKDCSKHRPQPSGESKRKHISTSESEDREVNSKPRDESGRGKPSGRKGKRFKKLLESESDSGCGEKAANGRLKKHQSEDEFSGGAGQRGKRQSGKRKHSKSYSSDVSADSEIQEESSNHKPSTSEPESDNSRGKPWRATRIRTRNLGKRTVNYRDNE